MSGAFSPLSARIRTTPSGISRPAKTASASRDSFTVSPRKRTWCNFSISPPGRSTGTDASSTPFSRITGTAIRWRKRWPVSSRRFVRARTHRGLISATCCRAPPTEAPANVYAFICAGWSARRTAWIFGLWPEIGAHRLVMPLDTHVARIGRALGLLKRKSNDWKAALEVTASLRAIAPDDPVRYDFAITHVGITGQWRDLIGRKRARY
ncbi:MAG: DUF2400 domain-containing protein [Deltaproteobacteria bacterium]|nr:DUF2400 domain-containing protein [Deltaproteobacteria bacterium]